MLAMLGSGALNAASSLTEPDGESLYFDPPANGVVEFHYIVILQYLRVL